MAKKSPPPRGPQLKLAGDLSVAFVNTAGARENNRQLGAGNYAELLIWGQKAGTLATSEAERLDDWAATRPVEAISAFTRIATVRASLSRLFLAVQRQEELPADDREVVSDGLAGAMPAIRLVPGEPGVTVGWAGDEMAPDRMVWPAWFSALQLLTSLAGRPQVRQCAAADCPLFFVDRTPSGRRRWCDMKTCGSRAKALRYYHSKGKVNRPKDWLYDRYLGKS